MTGSIAVALTVAVLGGGTARDTVALVGFRVLDVVSGRTAENQAVLVVDGTITWAGGAEEYDALVSEARTAGLALTGHIPADVGLKDALTAGQGLEHAEKIVNDVLGYDPTALDRLVPAARAIAAAGVPVTPTLAVQEVLTETDPV